MNELTEKRRIIFVGGHDLGCFCLDYLTTQGYQVVLCVGRTDDEGKDGIFPSLLKLAQEKDIPSIKPKSLNSLEVLKIVEETQGDIVFSIQNNMIFRNRWFDLFDGKFGIVNAHYAPLPRYGGFWPEMWAIWNDEKDFGVTLHYIDRGIDTGKIIAQYPVTILDIDTRKTLYDKCTQTTFQMFKDNLELILMGKLPGQEQDVSQRTYYKRELPNDGFVDFNWEPEKIRRFFRAISFCPFAGPKIRIGDRIISSIDEDLPFFKPIITQFSDYKR